MKKKIDSLMKNAIIFCFVGIGTMIFVALNYNVTFTQQKYIIIAGTSITLIGLLFRMLADRILNKKIDLKSLGSNEGYEIKQLLLSHNRIKWYLRQIDPQSFHAFVAYPEDMNKSTLNSSLEASERYVIYLLEQKKITNAIEVKSILAGKGSLSVA